MSFTNKGKLTPIAGIAIVVLVVLALSLSGPWNKIGIQPPSEGCEVFYHPEACPVAPRYLYSHCMYLAEEYPLHGAEDAPFVRFIPANDAHNRDECVMTGPWAETQVLDIVNGEWEWVVGR